MYTFQFHLTTPLSIINTGVAGDSYNATKANDRHDEEDESARLENACSDTVRQK